MLALKNNVDFNQNYLIDNFDNNLEFALDIIGMYLTIIPVQILNLSFYLSTKDIKEINKIIRRNLISFHLVGFPILTKRFGEFLVTSEADEFFTTHKLAEYEQLKCDINITFLLVQEEQMKLNAQMAMLNR